LENGKIMSGQDVFWDSLSAHQPAPILQQVESDWPAREAMLVKSLAGIRFDWTKTHLDEAMMEQFAGLADAMDLDAARRALFGGDIVNVTEGRAAEHIAQRGEGSPESVHIARMLHERMRALVDVIEAGGFGAVRHVLHIGIGGSALGPQLLVDALGRAPRRIEVAVVANVDGAALAEAIAGFDPHSTLIAIASKTFTTTETLMNARSALAWMTDAGVDDPMGRVIALTAMPERAVEWGVDETRVLPFPESVGGRYSLWSSIGFPAALALGWNAFAELLEGGAEMDRHFRLAPWRENIPLLAAMVDLWYSQCQSAQTRGAFAYDERLRLLPPYLQQLEMESNGKRVKADGTALDRESAPITWGGVGTDAQHAVFQLLHQGTRLIPVEFIAAKVPEHHLDAEHHDALLVNCFAQGAALMRGRASDDGARDYPGDRPSTTLLLDALTPHTLGALLAFYEHRTFANAMLLGINPFDQFGVELGKEMAKSVADGGGSLDPSTDALMAAAFDEGDQDA
jgi:glucose-6-phosphate isomerase